MKKYIEVKENTSDITHLKVEVYYDLGGYSYFTYTEKKRGYYVSVTPVKRWIVDGVQMESFAAFTGFKMLVKEVSRKSKKANDEVIQAAEKIQGKMIACVCQEQKLEVKENE
jgi:hypothetical protein